MRLGSRSPSEFFGVLGRKNEAIQRAYLGRITELARTVPVKVMMGDSTVTEQATFDPKLISDFFGGLVGGLEGWSAQDVSVSSNEDIRRIFAKFEIVEGDYVLSGHVSIQFHVLLYYKPVQRVIECQKELAKMVDMTRDREQRMADSGDEFVLAKLREMGYRDLDHQNLFEIFYQNDELRERVYAEIAGSEGADFERMSQTKAELFSELDSLLVETYQMSPALIDDSKLVTGEEGCLCTFDIELLEDGSRQGLFDADKMPDSVRKNILERLDAFERLI